MFHIVRTNKILGGFWTSFGITVFLVSLLIIFPLSTLFSQVFTLSSEEFFSILQDDRTVSALKISFLTAFIASFFNICIGLLVAWVLVRYEFYGKSILDMSIDLPFALPTAVVGISLVALYDKNFLIGKFLNYFGLEIPYTLQGIILAMIFTSLPFGIRPLQPVLKNLNKNLEEVARTLGASPFIVFFKVIFPQILPTFLKGFSLAFSRSLGEFGAVLFIAGNIPYETELASLLIMIRLEEFDYAGAGVIALIILSCSLFIIFTILFFEKYKNV